MGKLLKPRQFTTHGPYAAEMVVPVVRRRTRAAARETARLSVKDVPVSDDLVGDLFVTYAFDMPGRFDSVAIRHCDELGIDVADLREMSVRNLVERRSKPDVRKAINCVMVTLDNDLEAGLLLADTLWEELALAFPGELVAAVPARNTLVVTGSATPGGLAALGLAVKAAWGDPRTPSKLLLTPTLLTRRQATWQLL